MSRYLRPDAVMSTGVVRPTSGFAPQQDAYAITKNFSRSGVLRPTQLNGARWDAAKLKTQSLWGRFKAWISTTGAQKQAAAAASGGSVDETQIIAVDGSVVDSPLSGSRLIRHSRAAGLRDAANTYATSAMLPYATAVPGYPEQSAALTRRSEMAAKIMSGRDSSAGNPPERGAYAAAQQIVPRAGATTTRLAVAATGRAGGQVSTAAYSKAMAQFNARRRSIR